MNDVIYFKGKLLDLVRSGVKTSTVRLTDPKVPSWATLKDIEESAYRFATSHWCGTVKPRYTPGQILSVPEPWRCTDASIVGMYITVEFKDGAEETIAFSSLERFAKFEKYVRKGQAWQSPYFLPKEACRLRLMVDICCIRHIHNLTYRDIVREGYNPEANSGITPAQWMAWTWDKCLSDEQKKLYMFHDNPWVEHTEFHVLSTD